RVGESALNPDSDLGSIARAMLLFDHLEGIISHPRYRITYHLKHRSDDCDIIPRAYIEITRFNLGQARYEEVIKYVDKQHRPPRAIFEPGPHVSLRFAIGPIQGMYADVKQASRRTLSDAEAQAADCLGQPCLALQDARGPSGDWEAIAALPTQAADYREPAYDWAPGPARVAEALFIQANDGSALNPREVSEATSFEHPDMTMVISRNVQGQDNNIHGLLHWQGFMDDAISGLWLRMTALPGSEPQWQKHLVYARGGY
ncbi:MAG TPA: hypothetical protein VK110_09575, partial [Salinisphaeraceae bacterium]|nr:hypothetical protein [Salinisphaeraceae bacterium]